MGKYKKRPDGRYATSVFIGYTDDGRPKHKVLYGKTIQELENKLADFKNLQNKGIVIDDKNLTIGKFATTWLKLYKADKAYNTFEMYRRTVEKHIIPSIGNIRLSSLKPHHVQEMINNIIQLEHTRTAEIVKLTIRQIVKQAIIEEYIYKDVTVNISIPKKEKPQKRALTDEEKEFIQRAELNIKERAFVDILYYTGLRRGEALALMVSDVDFVNKKINVNKNLVFKSNRGEVKPSPKSDAGNREIPMPDRLIYSLRELIRTNKNAYLFTKEEGGLITQSAFRRFWDNITDKFNIAAGKTFKRTDVEHNKVPLRLIADDITPHLFRHTYATSLYNAGVDIKTAQYLLGHSSIQLTLDIYTHLDNSKIEGAAVQLNSFFDSQMIVKS